MIDWKKQYEQFKVALRKMRLNGATAWAGMQLGYVLYQLGEQGETPELMDELALRFRLFHERLPCAST